MYRKFFKRLLDILVSLIALPFVLLVLIIVIPLIYFSDRGPVFYNAPRLGRGGKVFKMYKLRSMRVNAPDIRNADGSTYNGDDDPRVTKIGRFIRKTSIDELPQFFNVLIGNMSIVGPRAHLATGYCGFDTLDDMHRHRLGVLPGITGYSQAYYRNAALAEEKLQHDCYYVDHMSFALDVKILLQTVKSVLKRENIYISQETKQDAPTVETARNK